jgi:hypothetical protein
MNWPMVEELFLDLISKTDLINVALKFFPSSVGCVLLWTLSQGRIKLLPLPILSPIY